MAEARSPLEHRAEDLDRLGAIEVPFLAQIDVRCGPEDAVRIGFPLEPNTVTGDLTRGALWLGPDERLAVGLPGTEAAIADELRLALAGSHHSIVDVSANRAVVDLRGEDRHELLATGCSLDLEQDGGWVSGRCAQTLFARTQVLLQEMEGATRVFVRPSFADYLIDRLLAASTTVQST